MKKFRVSWNLAGLAMLAIALSARADERIKLVQAADLPPVVRQSVSQQTIGGTIGRIVESPVTYEVDLTVDGLKLMFMVNEDASEFEHPMPFEKHGPGTLVKWGDLPEPVHQILSEKFPGAQLDGIRRRPVFYSVTVKTSEGDGLIRVSQDGRILSNLTAEELAEQKRAEERAMADHRAKESALEEHRAKERAFVEHLKSEKP